MSAPFAINQALHAGGNLEHDPAIDELHHFLQNAPRLWTSPSDPPVRKFKMANGEEISCVYWKGRFFVTGTDVVKILIFRFQRLGRGILNPKKFEEGVFSDLRNLKPGTEAVLEEPRSEFLEFLHKHGCIRTQKKQKVFFWHKVPHEDLFREALERNLKRVTNICNWTQMMNTPEMMKQYFMMQAGQMMMQGPTGPCLMMPAPQMIPNQFMPYASPAMMATSASGTGNLKGAMPAKTIASSDSSPILRSVSPSQGQMQPSERIPPPTHPRRTISMSNMDFRNADIQPTNLLTPQTTNAGVGLAPFAIPDISLALSSPLFELNNDYNESFFDTVSMTPSSSGVLTPTVTATAATSDADRQLDMPPDTIIPAMLHENDPTSSRVLEEDQRIDRDIIKELDALTTPALQPNELLLDTSMNIDLASGGDLLGDLWTDEKSPSSANEPLWDDLSMLIPTVAPNLRGDGV